MQLAHDMLVIRGGLNTYAEYSRSWSVQVKEAEAYMDGIDRLVKASKEQKLKLKEELATLRQSSWTTI